MREGLLPARLHGPPPALEVPPGSPPSPPRGSPPPPHPRQRRYSSSPPPRPQLGLPVQGDIIKYKPNITFDGTGNLESFLFTLEISFGKYNLTTNTHCLLAIGESLRREALDWWTYNARSFDTYK